MFLLVVRAAWANEPTEPPPGATSPEDPVPDGASLEATVQALEQQLAQEQLARQSAADVVTRLEALLGAASTVMDDRQSLEDRRQAAQQLAQSGDPRAWSVLGACARDHDPPMQHACVEAALSAGQQEAVDVARRLLLDKHAPQKMRMAVVAALGEHGSDEAAALLHEASQDREVPARLRAEMVETLEIDYGEWLASRGGAPPVVDPLGGILFVTANGLLGGMTMSSVGVWGEMDAGPAIGALGGAAVGLAGGGTYLTYRPLTTGQGLAYASGVTWGLTYGAWTTTAAHGSWRWTITPAADDYGAAYRAVGVLAGAGLGALAMRRDPSPWDVLEVDTAGYLGSAMALGVVSLAGYRRPEPTTPTFRGTFTVEGTPIRTPTDELTPEDRRQQESSSHAYERRASQRHAGAELGGATLGLAGGALLARRWTLEPEDAAMGLALGGQGAYLGSWLPALVGADGDALKGYVRLPWNGGIALGLLLAEIEPMPIERTGSTLWFSASGDALGAGLPMLVGYDDSRSIAAWTIPLGLLGTGSGIVMHSRVDPTGGDWAMATTGTAMALSQGALLGAALQDLGVWVDSGQATGLALTSAGVAGLGLYALGGAVEPEADEMLMLGCGAGWGAFYGAFVPLGFAQKPRPSTTLLSTSVTSALAAGSTEAAMLLGVATKDMLVPQLLAGSGATLGALGVALGSAEGRDAAKGAVIGATLGFGVGTAIELVADPIGDLSIGDLSIGALSRPLQGGSLRGRPIWLPLLEARRSESGALVPVAGVRAVRW